MIEKGKPKREILKSIILNTDQEVIEYANNLITGINLEITIDHFLKGLHPLIDPKTRNKYRQYFPHVGEYDKYNFIQGIGFRTNTFGGNKQNRLQYIKLFNKIQKEKLQGYYIIAGQDANEMELWLGFLLESIFEFYVESDDIQEGYDIISWNWRL